MSGSGPWWRNTTIYQVYPRSFSDSNGDGIGDLPGIIESLDHVSDMGFETLWVSPFFSSPQEDFGYDVSDFRDVAPEYGTFSDAQTLISEAHRRGLKVMFDMVFNHTSAEHPWFVESRSSRDNPKADWYIWHDGRPGRLRRLPGRAPTAPPNNWRSVLQVRKAWEWGRERQQWYMATFLPFQPDLNWRNPEVRAEMMDIARFWLDQGVDGFRLDIFHMIMKDERLRSNPRRPKLFELDTPHLNTPEHTVNIDDNFELAGDLREVAEEFDGDRVLLGEVFGSPQVLRRYVNRADAAGRRRPGLHLVFLFDFLAYKYSAKWFERCIGRYEKEFPDPLLPTYVLENHDRSRTASRVGGDLRKARVLATLLLTLRGVPTVYNGQEVGMTNTYIPLRQAMDPIARRYFSWIPETISKRMTERLNRDEMRTPMQWDNTAGAGFTDPDVEPWLPVGPDNEGNRGNEDIPDTEDSQDRGGRNVAAQQGDPASLMELYRNLLSIRKANPALRCGSLSHLGRPRKDLLSFRRSSPNQQLQVVCNLGPSTASVRLSGSASILLATDPSTEVNGFMVHLPADSAVILEPVQEGAAGPV